MEVALGSYYSLNGMALAISIFQFPEDYSNKPRIRTRALRYIYSHRKKYRNSPNLETLSRAGISMFDEFRRSNNLEGMREIADIMTEFTQGNDNLLDRIREVDVNVVQPTNIRQSSKSVYTDSQNVHNSKINQTVIKTLENLFAKYENFIILEGNDDKQKFEHKVYILHNIGGILVSKHPDKTEMINSSIEYIKTSTAIFGHRELGLIDGFIALWFWIGEHKHRDELEKRLLEEIKEMNGMCTTGHIARLMNVMQGFTEEESLSIRISNRDQCFAAVRQFLTKELKDCRDETVISEMTEGGENYIKFIRKSVAKKLLIWQSEYGKEMLKDIAEIVNDFAKATVFK